MKYIFNNFINTLRHYVASSVLNIFGMAVAFAAFYIILTQAIWGLRYNKNLEDVDNKYMLCYSSVDEGDKYFLSRPFAESILANSSEVESYGTALFNEDIDETPMFIKEGDKHRKVTPTFQRFTQGALDVFGFEAESGSFESLSNPGAVAISSEFAKKNNLKLGDRLSLFNANNPPANEIVAIWKDKFQKNSMPGSINALYDIKNMNIDNWSEWSYPYFVKLTDADSKEEFEKRATDKIREEIKQEDPNYDETQLKVSLIPVKDLYYKGDSQLTYGAFRCGNLATDVSLVVIAILTIVIAMINFVNFFFALVPARVKSVNTYMVFGTSREMLILNFILEAVGLVILALLLATFITMIFARTTATEILIAPLNIALNIPVFIATIAIAIIGAVLGSLYPAIYITSFQPALVLKGTFGSSTSGRTLRNILIGTQFTISMALIISAMFIRLQNDYMMNLDMGFNKQYLVSGILPSEVAWWGVRNGVFEDKMRNNPDIKDLTWSDGEIVNISRMGWGRNYKNKQINFQCFPVAYNFLDVMGIEITEGKGFSKSDEQGENGTMIFNEQAKKEFDITLEEYGLGHNGETAHIAGICKDFHFRPLQFSGLPFAFYLFGSDHTWRPQGLRNVYVRITEEADPYKVIRFIKDTVKEIAPTVDTDDIKLGIFDKELARKYTSEIKLGKQITAFTSVAIILSLMGVFGLVLFETQHKKKEIAIRRVLGASIVDVLLMICKKYSIIVLICFIVAAPVSWMIINRYLSNFAYHTTISWWVFGAAFIIVLAITDFIVVIRSLSTVYSNPVDSVKSE